MIFDDDNIGYRPLKFQNLQFCFHWASSIVYICYVCTHNTENLPSSNPAPFWTQLSLHCLLLFSIGQIPSKAEKGMSFIQTKHTFLSPPTGPASAPGTKRHISGQWHSQEDQNLWLLVKVFIWSVLFWFWCYPFGCDSWLCIQGSFLWGSRDHMGCCRSNSGWPHARQEP